MNSIKSSWRRRGAVVFGLMAAVMGGVTPEASAAIALPYNYTVNYISGGQDGVSTDKFYTNSSGQACFTANFKVKDMTSGGQWPNRTYYVQLWRNDTIGDTLIQQWPFTAGTTAYSATGKTCRASLGSNQDYHYSFKKAVFDTGTLTGYGTISYS